MTRRLPLLLALILVWPVVAHGQILQDKLEVFGGYSYLRFHNSPSTSFNGWEFSGQYNWNKWLSGVGDVGGVYGTWGGIGVTIHTYLFGPQVSYSWRRFTPFGHLLFGVGHRSGSGLNSTSFAYAGGGGLDFKLTHGIYWRFQGDYLPTNFFSATQRNRRFSSGIVFRF